MPINHNREANHTSSSAHSSYEEQGSELARDVVNGFSQEQKEISSRWFYDREGSRLFSEIMDLPEYYPTAREAEILKRHSAQILRDLGEGSVSFVELGAGDGRKTQFLLREALVQRRLQDFIPIDVSAGALEDLSQRLTQKFPSLVVRPMIGDNHERLREITLNRREKQTAVSESSQRADRLCALFLGSSIGNCERESVLPSLQAIRDCLVEGDHLLIGFDLVKESSRLVRAYSDSSGVTRAFNMNLLTRLNRELGADFDLSAFAHEATWSPRKRAMESWLVSRKDQSVYFRKLGRSFHFRKWEPLHTETSLKFDIGEIAFLAEQSGFESVALYTDVARDFVNVLWKAKRPGSRSAVGHPGVSVVN